VKFQSSISLLKNEGSQSNIIIKLAFSEEHVALLINRACEYSVDLSCKLGHENIESYLDRRWLDSEGGSR
jgi:hypothetical protein